MNFRTILILLIFSISPAISADIKDNLLDKSSGLISEFVSNLIPGDGTTEVSLDLRENHKPDFSILGVRELKKLENGNYFTQFSLMNTEQANDERFVGNLGIGTRRLSDDNTLMSGLNAFLDYDDNENLRASIGAEIRSAVVDLTTNYYQKIANGSGEKVLDGYDYQLSSQVPYLEWASIFYGGYKWSGVVRDDIEGAKYGSELFLSPTISLEFAYDDKKLKGLEDEWYARLLLTYPPRQGPTAQDGISSTAWKTEKDMSDQLLTKVKRQNKIMVEFDGLATISRLD